MKNHVKKPIRIEYYPQTKENINSKEDIDSTKDIPVEKVISKPLEKEIIDEITVEEEKIITQGGDLVQNEETIEDELEI